MTLLELVRLELQKKSSRARARVSQRYFKMGVGEYGEGDRAIGVRVPDNRLCARKFAHRMSLAEIEQLLKSLVHEERLCALLMLVMLYQKGSAGDRHKIVRCLLRNTRRINNWDLVDSCAPYCIGAYVFETETAFETLRKLARSRSVWERRIAIVATLYYIRQDVFRPTWTIATLLMQDTNDLIHKATGWMLREMGKRDRQELVKFLDRYHTTLPRTALRYCLEHFNSSQRAHYMHRKETN